MKEKNIFSQHLKPTPMSDMQESRGVKFEEGTVTKSAGRVTSQRDKVSEPFPEHLPRHSFAPSGVSAGISRAPLAQRSPAVS
jgi:hypothetical protein